MTCIYIGWTLLIWDRSKVKKQPSSLTHDALTAAASIGICLVSMVTVEVTWHIWASSIQVGFKKLGMHKTPGRQSAHCKLITTKCVKFKLIMDQVNFFFSGATFHIPLTKSATLNRLLHCSQWQFSGALFFYRGLFFFCISGPKSSGAPV